MSATRPPPLLDRAPLGEVLAGRAPLIGSRLDPDAPRGFLSPVEARYHMGIPYGDLLDEERRALASRSLPGDAGLIARAAAARALGAGVDPDVATGDRLYIVGGAVDRLSIDEAVAAILAPPSASDGRDASGADTEPPRARMIHFAHPHSLTVAARDPAHAGRLARADLVLPDGIGLRIAARMLGAGLLHNVNGTDLFPTLCRAAAEAQVPLALVGGAPGVAERCAENMRAATPGLRFALVHHGYLDDDASQAIADRLRALAHVVVLVGMGSPIQEAWAWRWLSPLPRLTTLTVGGLFDFYSGDIPRAPAALRELGLEWTFRLAQEPTRLARRYLVGNPLFLSLVALQRLGLRRR